MTISLIHVLFSLKKNKFGEKLGIFYKTIVPLTLTYVQNMETGDEERT